MARIPLTHERIFSNEAYAESYAQRHQRMAEGFGREYARKLSAHGFQGGKVIDVGCGFGATNLVLAQRFVNSEFIGVDLSRPLLQIARKGAEAAHLGERVRFEEADVQEIPYGDNWFDVVINVNMVHIVDDPIRMLNEIERILVPGGFLFIGDLRRSWLGLLENEIRSALTLKEARQLFARANLRPGKFTWDLLWWRFETPE
jgi:ubiquinone/menaquinone biosynthesis C-methylase UbiE